MKRVFDQRPYSKAREPITHYLERAVEMLKGKPRPVGHGRQPNDRNHPPGGFAYGLQEVAEQWCRFSTFVVSGPMDLLQIKVLAEPSSPDLHEQWLIEIEELEGAKVGSNVCFHGQVLC